MNTLLGEATLVKVVFEKGSILRGENLFPLTACILSFREDFFTEGTLCAG